MQEGGSTEKNPGDIAWKQQNGRERLTIIKNYEIDRKECIGMFKSSFKTALNRKWIDSENRNGENYAEDWKKQMPLHKAILEIKEEIKILGTKVRDWQKG